MATNADRKSPKEQFPEAESEISLLATNADAESREDPGHMTDAEIESRVREILAARESPEAMTCSREELMTMTRRVLQDGIIRGGKKQWTNLLMAMT